MEEPMSHRAPISVKLGIAEISFQLLLDNKRVIVYFDPNGATLNKSEIHKLMQALQNLHAEMA